MVDPGRRIRRPRTDRVQFIGQIGLLIMDAYNLPVGSDSRIVKGPKWMDSEADRYEVEAKIDATLFAAMQGMTPEQQHEQVALMEQSLLAERFKLKVHFEVRGETPVYALVVARGGSKLTPAKDGEPTKLSSLKNEITAQAVTLDQFAHSPLWTPIGDRLVVDHTGLTGAYDFTLKWRADPLDASNVVQGANDLPPLFDAIEDQLGLRVVSSKAPLEVIVIDHIERPSAN
jgi:bla regulator protein BlaR1